MRRARAISESVRMAGSGAGLGGVIGGAIVGLRFLNRCLRRQTMGAAIVGGGGVEGFGQSEPARGAPPAKPSDACGSETVGSAAAGGFGAGAGTLYGGVRKVRFIHGGAENVRRGVGGGGFGAARFGGAGFGAL